MSLSRKIYRYMLILAYRQTVSLPAGFRILHVAPGRPDGAHIDVWAVVEPSKQQLVDVDFYIVGTGRELPTGEISPVYRGTAVMPSGYVWHVYYGLSNRHD